MVVRGGSFVRLDCAKVPRIGVLPRYAQDESEMKWFEVLGFNLMHTTNAWDEADGEEIVLVAPNNLSINHILGNMELVQARVDMVRINLNTGAVSCTTLSSERLEFGVVHKGHVGRPNRYGYFGVSGPMPMISGITKLDFDRVGTGDCMVTRHDFSPGCFAGEPFFLLDNINGDGKEDNAYVVCFTHEEATAESRFVVMDARSPELRYCRRVVAPSPIEPRRHPRPLSPASSGGVLSAMVPHVMLGYTVVVVILAYFLLFSGFFINRDRIPEY
ncbi:hypothetical protein E2562_032270 [Oryza meyeriana var. granulata]|uniref:Uncharacterized protein n=1 Tax=Oryza meyeriana var. granulata TaxID=110450 RepID=A0A6G1F0F0_9ORYZ|nr:hypothetical protein E2562_032270 [Oryza meyeriana var. granulata]